MLRNRTLHLLVELQNDTATLDECLVVSYKVKQTYHTIPQLHSYLPNYVENLCPGKILHITVVRVIAQNCKQPRCPSLEEWIYKLWYNRILQINKK